MVTIKRNSDDHNETIRLNKETQVSKAVAIKNALNAEAGPLIDEAELWRAVESKDAAFDGLFVFAVTSTGVYCRPSCPSRRARRDRVQFFRLPEGAERAGFRSCKRCKPDAAPSPDPHVELVRKACRIIESRQPAPGLDELSTELGISQFHLQRVFKRIAGVTPRQYARARRVDEFKERVKRGDSIVGAMYDAGYGSSSRLYESATEELGMTPAELRRGGRGMQINFATAACSLGRILVGATEKGVCAVSLGESDKELESMLKSEYPEAKITRGGKSLDHSVALLLDHLQGEQPHLDLPIDVQATAFQRRVWEELRKIPYGDTRSYGYVAKAIGSPSSVRAVARACATNRVALVIPCYRVIREDKSLGGYKWGLRRKEKLLKNESARAQR